MKRAGFTFVEVLFALFITAMTALTIGYTLIVTLHAEERGNYMREATMVLSSLQAATQLELEPEDSAVPTGWRILEERIAERHGTTQTVWRVQQITRAGSDFRSSVAFIDPDP